MGSITSFNSKRAQKLFEKEQEEKKEKARRKARPGLLKKTIKEKDYCPFCGSVMHAFAIRKDNAKKIPLCRECTSYAAENAPWILSIEQI